MTKAINKHASELKKGFWAKIPAKKRSRMMSEVSQAWVDSLTPKARKDIGKRLAKGRKAALKRKELMGVKLATTNVDKVIHSLRTSNDLT